ncbi:melanoregulin-like [Heterodontus francisci]|uniref:melanoregulin-like n=1 Tax=Heterodontus francisci TaxID=7792 RepID=UPI00355ADB26
MMGPREFLCSICCCQCLGAMKTQAKQPLLRDGRKKIMYSALESPWDYERNLWSSPRDSSHTQADDDWELFNLLTKRKQADKDSEEWQKLNYDIHTLRQNRRQLRNRWKRILEDLGFQNEADNLLSVTESSTIHTQNLYTAQEMLQRLTKETNIFPNECQVPERYLFVLDRLLALDAAEDFVGKASQRYPKDSE